MTQNYIDQAMSEKEPVRNATSERTGLPAELLRAHARAMGPIYLPETSALLQALEDDPQREMKLRSEFRTGNPGALMIFAACALAERKEDEWFAFMYAAYNKGSGQAAFELAHHYEQSDPRGALSKYEEAVERGHLGARYAMVNLLKALPPEQLAISDNQHAILLKKFEQLADQLLDQEVFNALRTGAHPVQFRAELDIPWGTGTFFLVRWKDREFAVTARHCVVASQADPNHARLMVPHREGPVPFLGHFALDDERTQIEDERDIFMWEVGGNAEDHDAGWWSWRLDHLWKPAKELREDQKIFVVGFPNVEERVDYESGKLDPHCLIIRGDLAKDPPAGLLAVDCAEFDVTTDGVSGGPVFATFDGIFFFVGMAVRGSAESRRIHFIDAVHVVAALDQAVAGHSR